DLVGRQSTAQSYHAVEDYDGIHLPLPDASADVVFSSNVLEHVRDLPALLEETRRVIKPRGLAIHTLPTPSWRFWSIVAHYPLLVWAALGIRPGFVDRTDPGACRARIRQRGVGHVLRRALWPGPHGEFPGALAELRGFRAAYWTGALQRAGFAIESVSRSGLYYSGYGLFAGLPLTARCRMARVLGSSTQIIVARRSDGSQHAREER